jgi:hypothetical protein
MMIGLNKAYRWLNIFRGTQIKDTYAHLYRQLYNELVVMLYTQRNSGLTSNEWGDAYSNLQTRLNRLIEVGIAAAGSETQAEIRVCCSRIEYLLREYQEAAKLLREGASKYSGNLHKQAVAWWMLGCVLWESQPTRGEALVYWTRSRGAFRELQMSSQSLEPRYEWYAMRIDGMRQHIQDSITAE